MAEKPKDPAKAPVRIDDLPATTPDTQDESVKGGMIRRGGSIGTTDEDMDEVGD